MKKEIFKVTIKVEREKQFKPHYLNAEREFKIEAGRGKLFITLDSIERKLRKVYPLTEILPIPNETKVFAPTGDGNDKVDSSSPLTSMK